MKQTNAKTGYASPASLTPHPRNSRKHSVSQIATICASIEKHGFIKPVIVDEDRVILAGHGAVLAAIDLKLDRIPIRQIFELSDEEKRSFVIADNRTAELSKWDWDMLGAELKELQSVGDLKPLGFEDWSGDAPKKQTKSVAFGADRFLLQLEFDGEVEMQKWFDELKERGVSVKILS